MITLPAIIGVIGVILTIAGVLAAAAAVFRTSTFRSTIEDQARAIAALRERVQVTEEAGVVKDTKIAALQEEVKDLRRTKEILASEVTGSAKLAEIASALIALAQMTERNHAQVVQILKKLPGGHGPDEVRWSGEPS